jgi:uncharacterized membrane protein
MMTDTAQPAGASNTGQINRRWWPALALLVIALLALLAPRDWFAPLDYIGSAVCHRIPVRTLFVDGRQLPVCARDTGMFTVALIGMTVLFGFVGRSASDFPRRPYFWFFALCFIAWGFDGFNSYMLLVRREVFLYEPSNLLRLVTGSMMGMAMASFALALFNQVTWRNAGDAATVRSMRTLGALIGTAAAVVVIGVLRPNALYGPMALLSSLGVVAMLTLVNGMLLLLLTRRYSQLQTARELTPFGLAGTALALLELGTIAALRATFLPELGPLTGV